jgi:hypothetical protein
MGNGRKRGGAITKAVLINSRQTPQTGLTSRAGVNQT